MPVNRTTTLTFSADDQSLWGPGAAASFNLTTGNKLIFDPDKSSFDIGFGGSFFGVAGQAYVDFKIGLEAYASLGTAGSFDTSISMQSDVSYAGAVAAGTQMAFDFTELRVGATKVSTTGFSGPSAGLDLVIGASAGIENFQFTSFFYDSPVTNFSIINIDTKINLLKLDSSNISFEVPIIDGLKLKGTLPTGANLEETASGVTVIEASGASETKFLELAADLDSLLTQLLQKMPPPVAAVGKVLADTVFAEHEFDLNDYISLIPKDAVAAKLTILDIGASAGAVVTEKAKVDFGGNGSKDTPDVFVTLRSDNGTAGDATDDKTVSGFIGEAASVYNLAAPLTGEGTARISATYEIRNVNFTHSVGLGMNLSFGISALSGSIADYEVGPVVDITLPENGFNFDLFSHTFSPFAVTQSAFTKVQDSFDVFYTNVVPGGWDQNAPNAVQQLYAYKQFLAQNLNSAIDTFGEIWNNNPAVQAVTILGGVDQATPAPSHPTNNTAAFWFGGANSTFNLIQDPGVNNYVIVSTPDESGGVNYRLSARLYSPNFEDGISILGSSSALSKSLALEELSTVDFVEYGIRNLSTNASFKLTTSSIVEIRGGSQGDALPYLTGGVIAGSKFRPTLFDGGGAADFVNNDTFLADFLATDPNTAISIDLFDLRAAGGSAQLANGLVLRNIESLVVKTGNANDYIGTLGTAFTDIIHTNGGDDIVESRADNANDEIRLGAGKDVVITGFQGAVNDGDDLLYGGTGEDYGVFTSGGATGFGLRMDIVENGAAIFAGLGFADGIGADALPQHLLAALVDGVYDIFFDQSPGFAHDALAQDPGARDALKLINGTSANGTALIYNDIEHISVIGSDAANDLVVFTGSLTYVGGDGANSDADTFFGDFGRYAAGLNATGGVHINANGARFAFGDATIEGFERFSVIGTKFDDILAGGAFRDVLVGGEGNDTISGGNDAARDLMSGGLGDDSYSWAGNGADLINDVESGDSDTLLIDVSNVAIGNGLVYDFQTLSDANFYNDTAGANRGTFEVYRPTFSTEVLLEALQLMSAPAGGDDYNAVAFTTFLTPGNDSFMTYREVEHVNIIGNNATNDLLIYQGGDFYIGGENAGETDAFVADFTGDAVGIAFNLGDGPAGTVVSDAAGKILENGVFVSGIERAVIKAGSGNDTLFGSLTTASFVRRDDWFDGGGGDDALYGGTGSNTLLGGEGRDFVLWDGLGNDAVFGGEGDDGLTVKGRDGGLVASFVDATLANGSNGAISAASTLAEMIAAVAAAPTGFEFNYASGSTGVTYREFEHVDAFGSAAFDDFVLYQGSAAYVGGEQDGDDDVFAGNFGGETQNLTLDLTRTGTSQLGNGGLYAGFERAVVMLGQGGDLAVGGSGADYLAGGDGGDFLYNGGGTPASPEDKLFGDGGDDTLVYTGGRAWMDGGSGFGDHAIIEFNPTLAVTVDTLDAGGNFLTPNPFAGGLHVNRAYLLDFVNTALPGAAGIGYNFDASFSDDVKLFNVERVDIAGSTADDFLVSGTSDSILVGDKGRDVLVSRGGGNVLVGGSGVDDYVFSGHVGDTVIAGENLNGGRIYFLDRARSEVTFNVNANDLTLFVAGGAGGQVVIRNYFAPGQANGLNFTFDFTDFKGKVTTAPDGFATAPAAAGPAFTGTAKDDEVNQNSAGANSVRAGDGDDVIFADAGNDTINGGAGSDTVSFAHLNSGVLIDLGLHIGQFAEAQGDIYLSIENAAGGKGNNTLRGSGSANLLYGNIGIDTIDAGQGSDIVYGFGNDDVLNGELGDDTVFGGEGDDTVSGDEGGDELLGGDGDDAIYAGDGDDLINGGAGDDFSLGGQGDDTYFYGGSEVPETPAHEDGFDRFNGGAGANTADFGRFGAAVRVNFGLKVNTVQTTDGPDLSVGTLRTAASLNNVQNFNGTEFDDILIGSAAANVMFGDLGNDIFRGGGGADSLDGGAGLDVYDGSEENGATGGYLGTGGIFVDFSGANPNVHDSNGNDDAIFNIEMYIGSSQTDYFLMGDADDDVRGGGSGDYIDGGAGNDFIEGGEGGDNLIGGAGAGNLLAYGSSNAAVKVDLLAGTASGGHADGDSIQDFAHVIGSVFGDKLSGDNANNMVAGGAGSDSLNGRAGDDQLLGGEGKDTLRGSAGNDSIIGGADADQLAGGSGKDTFVYASSAEGNDSIGDWVAAGDQLQISAAGFGGGLGAGALALDRLVAGAAPAADQAYGQFLFQTTTGQLSWDADGTGAGAAVNIAQLLNGGIAIGALSVLDIDIVA